jgi:hypothetical protein
MRRSTEEWEAERAELLEEMRGLRSELRAARKERDEATDRVTLADEVVDLKKQIVDLEINKSKLTEEHAREKREVTHMVGLERKRGEFEVERASKQATLVVREENLAHDKAKFEEHLAFMNDRFGQEVGYLKELMSEMLGRLPTVTVDKSIETKPAARRAS